MTYRRATLGLHQSAFRSSARANKGIMLTCNESFTQFVYKIPLLTRALGLKAKQLARATIEYIVYNDPM